MQMINSTVYGNAGGGIFENGSTYILDSILWGNTHSFFTGQRAQIDYPSGTSPPILSYNSIEGWTGSLGGTGNVGLNPLFVDPDGQDDIPGTPDDNYRLSPDSPLINLGHPNPLLAPYLEGDGHARILCGRIDMGAFEFGIGDYNCDRVVELADFAAFPFCLTGPAPELPYPAACAAYDFVTEIAEDVDLLDYAGWQNSFDVP